MEWLLILIGIFITLSAFNIFMFVEWIMGYFVD